MIVSARERLELLGLELQEEKLRFVQSLIWIAAAVFTAMLAITFASITIVFLFWETARLAVLIGLTTFYAIAFGWVLCPGGVIRGRESRGRWSRPKRHG